MDNHTKFLKNKFNEVHGLVPENSKILDIGCNDGNLRHHLKNAVYYGVDLDENLINQLKKQGVQAEKVDLNKEKLPFEHEKFDFVTLLDVIEHVVDPRKLIQDSKDKLNPNGKIIITLPNDYHILNKLRFLFNKPLTEDVFAPFGHLHYFPIKTGEKFLKDNNLKILKKYPIPPTKPSFFPQSFKNILGKLFPQSFARDILYLVSVN